MTESEPLFVQFCAALNGELTTLGCRIRVMPRPSPPRYMMLVDIGDKELGWVPDHIDAASIMAFDEILQCDRRAGGQGAFEDDLTEEAASSSEAVRVAEGVTGNPVR